MKKKNKQKQGDSGKIPLSPCYVVVKGMISQLIFQLQKFVSFVKKQSPTIKVWGFALEGLLGEKSDFNEVNGEVPTLS
ncbi:hypothetical protein [Bacillus sp. cl95]|uniref:hypothetical protein n=1 Tax=Bacillus sp. cl95 TaxID=1761761 RepID=UPI000B837231|nr:hypothetical protein [Bacillus sp. cl95]